MKRDMNLCRLVLIEVESWQTTLEPRQVVIPGRSRDEVDYHAYLLLEAGLVEGRALGGQGDPVDRCWPRAVTWRGHDFLELARDDTRWAKAAARVSKVGGRTLEILRPLLQQMVAKELGIG